MRLRSGTCALLACAGTAWVSGYGGYQHCSRPGVLRGVGKLPELPERRDVVSEWAQGFLQLAGTVLLGAGAFYGGAKVAVINQPQRPELQGSAVGSRLVRLAGLRCRVLYPCQRGSKEAAYLSEGRRTSDAMARLVFFPGFLLEHLGAASSGCWEDAKAAGPWPILIYSHGQGGNMDMGTFFLRQMASYGMIVVSVEHQDGSASTGDESNPRPFRMGGQLGVRYRATELVEVTKALVTSDLVEDLQGDRKNILVGGHSYGGPTAILAAAAAPERYSGLVLHDPALSSPMPALALPVSAIVGDEYAGISQLLSVLRKVCAQDLVRPWAGAWHFRGISHGNFVDAPLWAGALEGLGLIRSGPATQSGF